MAAIWPGSQDKAIALIYGTAIALSLSISLMNVFPPSSNFFVTGVIILVLSLAAFPLAVWAQLRDICKEDHWKYSVPWYARLERCRAALGMALATGLDPENITLHNQLLEIVSDATRRLGCVVDRGHTLFGQINMG